jgi:hypothetical protein
MYVEHKTKARFCRHYCSGKAMSITDRYYERVFVAVGTQYAMRMRHIVTCGLPCCTVICHTLINDTIFERKKKVIEYVFFLRRTETDMIENVY